MRNADSWIDKWGWNVVHLITGQYHLSHLIYTLWYGHFNVYLKLWWWVNEVLPASTSWYHFKFASILFISNCCRTRKIYWVPGWCLKFKFNLLIFNMFFLSLFLSFSFSSFPQFCCCWPLSSKSGNWTEFNQTGQWTKPVHRMPHHWGPYKPSICLAEGS